MDEDEIDVAICPFCMEYIDAQSEEVGDVCLNGYLLNGARK